LICHDRPDRRRYRPMHASVSSQSPSSSHKRRRR
jgi:hypothetical protein